MLSAWREHNETYKLFSKTTNRRALVTPLVLSVCLLTVACNGHPAGNNNSGERFVQSFPVGWESNLDVLLVMDNSESMVDEYERIRVVGYAFDGWYRALAVDNSPLNLHIGVTTTDYGVGQYSSAECSSSGNGGLLVGEQCLPGPQDHYIVDVAPRGCNVVKEYDMNGYFTSCSYHDCTIEHCQHEPSTTLVSYMNGTCPRCRNFVDESLPEMLSCFLSAVADVNPGPFGCHFKQPLRSMRGALQGNPENEGFLRDRAMLAVAVVTDDDDCSATDDSLFDPAQDSISSPLGFYSKFRCFEFGVSCSINDRSYQGARTDCRSREDGGGYLASVDSYLDFVQSLRDFQMFDFALISGPFENGTVVTVEDSLGRPTVSSSCQDSGDGARPAVRLTELHDRLDMPFDGVYSICDASTIDKHFDSWGDSLGYRIESYRCLQHPLEGCRDAAAWWGEEGDGETCNDICQPDCVVRYVKHRGTADETTTLIARCVEVTPSGEILQGNTDKEQSYANGKPPLVDPMLPVEACWYVEHAPECVLSNGTSILVVQKEAAVRTFVEISCVKGESVEEDCFNGIDDDQDCYYDMQDSDCY